MLKTSLRVCLAAGLLAGLALLPTAAHGTSPTSAPYPVTTPYITGATTATPISR